jgi:hypothetical protein
MNAKAQQTDQAKQAQAQAKQTEQTKKDQELEMFKKTLENKASAQVSDLYKNGNFGEKDITNILQQGFDEFKNTTGRSMTYSEMREMYG